MAKNKSKAKSSKRNTPFSKTSHQERPGAQVLNTLAALFNEGRYPEVGHIARKMTERFPSDGFGWKCLGVAFQLQGRTGESLEPMKKAAALLPGDAESHYNLSITFRDLGRQEEAEASCRRALEIKPDYVVALVNLGNIQHCLGRLDEAEANFRRALEIKPDDAMALVNLGNIQHYLGRLDEAEANFRRALEIKPDDTETLASLGKTLQESGRHYEAEARFRMILEINPDNVEAHNNLGITLKNLGRPSEAEASYRKALGIKPDYAEAHFNLGNILMLQGRLKEAGTSYHNALEIRPDFADAHNNLGTIFQDLGRLEEAEASRRRALEIKPDDADAHSNLLFSMNHSASHHPSYRFEEACRYGQMVAGKVGRRFSHWNCIPRPERLRVGVVSGDLCIHPVGYFLKSMLAQIDRSRMELITYPTTHNADELTASIKPYFSAWKPLSGLSDEDAAGMIHGDGVHILLDLSGHTAGNRLPVFAWKPAPVQAGWLGYFATTGVAEMDYILADEVGVPEAQREQFTEAVWYLPDTRLCFSPPEIDLPVTGLPALHSGHSTFGCFQRMSKIGDRVLVEWEKILNAVPGAKLRLQCIQLDDPGVVELLAQRLQHHGIDQARVSFHGGMPREAYLAAHAEVDLILDTFPYPGGTTTCEALWMGVPTLTLAGGSLVSRQGASLLTAVGLAELVAASEADYVEKAIAMARDVPKLARIRAGLRQQALASPLFDAPRFARHFETALWSMWERWQTAPLSQTAGKATHECGMVQVPLLSRL